MVPVSNQIFFAAVNVIVLETSVIEAADAGV